jgi:putrescine aminotransferase
MAELLPEGISKTTFGVSGGEAIDCAIKFSRAYTKRKDCVSAVGGYHGHTGFALATGDPSFKITFFGIYRDLSKYLWRHKCNA